MANQMIPAGRQSRALVAEAAVGDELARAGMGFGELIKTTGLAIAETQNKLNETGANTATALAETLVDVIAVEEKVYLDDGTLDSSKSRTLDQKLPLITFIDPVFYQWTNVRLQGRFTASEFATDNTSESYSHQSRESYSQHGLLVIFGGGHNSYQYSSQKRQNEEETISDYSYGQMRMNTLLEPRDDIGIPKPNQAIQGPRLTLVQGEIADVMGDGRVIARTMSMIVQFNRRNGTPISGKVISIETNGVSWSYTGDHETDTSGQTEFQLRRDFLDENADTTPVDIIISARIGMVQNNVTVVF
jgi:hypothetical protein